VLGSVISAICWIAKQIGHGKYFRAPSAQWSKYLKPPRENDGRASVSNSNTDVRLNAGNRIVNKTINGR
jgi:hypothetical protein